MMNVLSVNSLSKSFGERTLFRNISFGLGFGEKVALVARNGSGKTTLFKIIKGSEIPDEGEVVFRKEIRVAFLDQDFALDEKQSVKELIDNAEFPVVHAIKAYQKALEVSKKNTDENSARALDEALKRMNELDAWSYEKNAIEILSRLGISDIGQPIST